MHNQQTRSTLPAILTHSQRQTARLWLVPDSFTFIVLPSCENPLLYFSGSQSPTRGVWSPNHFCHYCFLFLFIFLVEQTKKSRRVSSSAAVKECGDGVLKGVGCDPDSNYSSAIMKRIAPSSTTNCTGQGGRIWEGHSQGPRCLANSEDMVASVEEILVCT